MISNNCGRSRPAIDQTEVAGLAARYDSCAFQGMYATCGGGQTILNVSRGTPRDKVWMSNSGSRARSQERARPERHAPSDVGDPWRRLMIRTRSPRPSAYQTERHWPAARYDSCAMTAHPPGCMRLVVRQTIRDISRAQAAHRPGGRTSGRRRLPSRRRRSTGERL